VIADWWLRARSRPIESLARILQFGRPKLPRVRVGANRLRASTTAHDSETVDRRPGGSARLSARRRRRSPGGSGPLRPLCCAAPRGPDRPASRSQGSNVGGLAAPPGDRRRAGRSFAPWRCSQAASRPDRRAHAAAAPALSNADPPGPHGTARRRFGVRWPRRRQGGAVARRPARRARQRGSAAEARPGALRVAAKEPRLGPVARRRRPLQRGDPCRRAPLLTPRRAPRPASHRPRAQAAGRSGTACRPPPPPGGKARRTDGLRQS
jgi:hypothetical protein